MKLADPSAYYADRAVEHTAQGDIYAGIPLVQATNADSWFQAAGAPKRPGGPDPDHSTSVAFTGLAIVLHYTCGFTAQPPGTRGYSHEHRLMAPILDAPEDAAAVTQALLDCQPRVARLTSMRRESSRPRSSRRTRRTTSRGSPSPNPT